MPPKKRPRKPVGVEIPFGGNAPVVQPAPPQSRAEQKPSQPKAANTDMFGRPMDNEVPDFGAHSKKNPRPQKQQQQPARTVTQDIVEAPQQQSNPEMVIRGGKKGGRGGRGGAQGGKQMDFQQQDQPEDNYQGRGQQQQQRQQPSNYQQQPRQNDYQQQPRQNDHQAQNRYQQQSRSMMQNDYQPRQNNAYQGGQQQYGGGNKQQQNNRQGGPKPNQGNQQKEKFQQKTGKRIAIPEFKNEQEQALRIKLIEKFEGLKLEKEGPLSYNESLMCIYQEFDKLYRSQDPELGLLCEDMKTKVPDLQTDISGGEQIEPALLPLKFKLTADREQFEAQFSQWRQSPDALLEQMLTEMHDDRLSSETLDPLFKFDMDTLKKSAAAEAFNLSPEFCQSKKEFITPKLDHIFSELKSSDAFIELECTVAESLQLVDESRLVACSVHDPLSGLLQTFDYAEPSSISGLTGIIPVQEPLLEQDAQEIDLVLEGAMDPFGNDEEDQKDPGEPEDFMEQSRRFLRDMRDLSRRQEMEAQSVIKAAQVQPGLLVTEQGKVEEEEEKAPVEESQDSTVDEKSVADPDQIDEIMGENSSFQEAVNRTNLMQNNAIQAEPSRFHLASISNEREKPSAQTKILNEMQKNEDKKWVVMDKIDVTNFKQMIPEPAISYPFELDEFQKRAVYRLEQGNCVFVAAHTSAGKTLVAEYAIALSRQHMTKTIYTSPIKTLSNQKYRDFKLKFGDVGVLTGDVSLNRDASCMIMTTEVLQAMLYNDSNYVQDVEWVIFDEVHYINDPERGHVWEEVIIKLPDTVSIVMLSATVPNYKEFAEWVGRTKQKKVYVEYTLKRPVPLQHFSILDGKINMLKDSEKEVNVAQLKTDTSRRARIKREQFDRPEDNRNEKSEAVMEFEEREKKKIDFKEKAIQAKNKSIKKTLAKQTKQSNSGGGSKSRGPNSGQKAKAGSAFNKSIQKIFDDELLPCIAFTFSRPKTVELAENLEGQFDFTDVKTKGIIRRFIKQKLQRLEPDDRDLPQIRTLSKLLVRGIGVHHAGLLALLKELVEILFSDGYLKLVIATSTFAIGLNLPARSVMFTTMKKFDGDKVNVIPTSEYLQMAGRAGRRGKDTSGMSLLCLDPEMDRNVPTNEEFQELLSSQGVALESQFKVDYKTCLNTLKEESGQFESLMAQSFLENQNMVQKLQMMKRKQIVEPLFNRIKEIECPNGCPDQAGDMIELLTQLWETNYTLNNNKSPLLLTFVEITTAKFWFKRALVLRIQADICLVLVAEKASKKGGKNQQSAWPVAYEEAEVQGQRRPLAQSTVWMAELQEHWEFEYVEVQMENINKYYQERVQNMNAKHLHFTDQKSLHNKHLRLMLLSFSEKLTGGAWKEDHTPYKTKKKVNELLKRREDLIAKMQQTKLWHCEQLSYHMTQLYQARKYKKELEEIMKCVQGGTNEKEREFNKRNEILQIYNIIDKDLSLLFKGKVAAKVTGADAILLTEFFFSGLINELTDLELLAILSTFSSENKAGKDVDECSKVYSESFTKAINFIQKECDRLMAKEQEFGLLDNTQQRINWKFYELVYEWADGKPFSQLVSMSEVEEGMIVKMLMSVHKLTGTIEGMAQIVGDNTLATRMDEMKPLTQRGIVKLQSLYLEVEQEQLTATRENIGTFSDDEEDK